MDDEQVASILDAMEGRVLDGDKVTGWSKRQPLREDGAAERAKAWRERKKQEEEHKRTHANANEHPDTDTDTEKSKEKTLSGKPDDASSEASENAQAKSVLDYLNEKTHSGYRPVASNLRLVRARLAEGFTVDDVKAVIDRQVGRWRGDPKMEPYLRPKTLFAAGNFANYAGQALAARGTHSTWWKDAGFQSPYEAENAGCNAHIAHQWRDGKRIEAIV